MVTGFLSKIINWLHAGYPEGIPPKDYFPVLALLQRRLTDDEVKSVANKLSERGDFADVDIGVAITRFTHEMPSSTDIERVRDRLAKHGWPLDDPREAEAGE